MEENTPKIVKCKIGPYPKGFFDPMPQVNVVFDNGEEKMIFDFYPDEISFTENEFIGLTEESARKLKGIKDREYLLS
jgi:hypothetical protein